MNKHFFIKTASILDINTMIEWAKEEGWNPGLHDALPFHVTDPQGFFIGYLNDQPIASLSAVRYANDFAFIGFYIVSPHYRGNGYGFLLWQHGLKYISHLPTGLDGVIAQQTNYQKSGFHLAHRNIRFEGKMGVTNASNLINAATLPFDLIVNYDQQFFPAARPGFLAAWIHSHCSYAVIDNQEIVGYGVIRQCEQGFKIGPLFANTMQIAEKLFFALCHHAEQDTVYIDVPETNGEMIKFIHSLHFKPIFETARMYKGQPPIVKSLLFGITSFELG